MKLATVILASFALLPSATAGPIAYGLCQTGPLPSNIGLCCSRSSSLARLGCNVLAVACYAAAGAVFGTVAAPAAPPAILACNAALGTCSTTCATVALLAPTP
jgi:hypothetical protein